MPLTTLDQVKAKLQIPASDSLDDTALAPVRDAAEAYVLAATGYVLADTVQTETFRPVLLGQPLWLGRRPVAGVSAQARALGTTTWTALAVDVVDAAQGVVVLPVGPADPPLPAGPGAPWLAWRAGQWDVVAITYTAQALGAVPADLSDATATLAAHWYRQQLAGPVTASQVGLVQEQYADAAVPPAVAAVLARYRRPEARWA